MSVQRQFTPLLTFLVIALGAALFTGCEAPGSEAETKKDYLAAKNYDVIQGEEEAVLTEPPMVPPPIDRDYATKVIVRLETLEKEMELADGVKFDYWTFGGTVPGKFIRVREGDLVEFHLMNNPENKMPHNIDIHAVTGPGGGAASSFTAPGHESIFEFTALNPGLYMYYCATSPVGMHVSHGMYGMMLVEPKEGLPEVDREYYVVQSEFYTKGEFGDQGMQKFDMAKALNENPDYVVFNGAVDALTGDKALEAEVGEKVRIFFGNAGPSKTSSFRIVGEIFDNVYQEGGVATNHNVATTLVPVGGATIVEFTTDVPGSYKMIDQSFFRAFNKGAMAEMQVGGEENLLAYSGKSDDRIYLPEGSAVQEMPGGEGEEQIATVSKEERIQLGQTIYTQVCQACHQADGNGIPGAFPPLAESDWINGNVNQTIAAVVKGLQGQITVNGETYNGVMPAQNLSDEEVANVLTYVYNNWGNDGSLVTPSQVASVR